MVKIVHTKLLVTGSLVFLNLCHLNWINSSRDKDMEKKKKKRREKDFQENESKRMYETVLNQ